MKYIFNGCSSLIDLDLSNFDTSLVTSFEYMFSGCNSLQDLNIKSFNLFCNINGSFIF